MENKILYGALDINVGYKHYSGRKHEIKNSRDKELRENVTRIPIKCIGLYIHM